MNTFKKILMPLFLVAGLAVLLFAPIDVSANAIDDACKADPSASICQDSTSVSDVIAIVVNTLLFIVGIISVIMIIVGGIMYTTSAGDSGQVTKAKNTILFSVIGLAVSFFAYAIVNWVVLQFI